MQQDLLIHKKLFISNFVLHMITCTLKTYLRVGEEPLEVRLELHFQLLEEGVGVAQLQRVQQVLGPPP